MSNPLSLYPVLTDTHGEFYDDIEWHWIRPTVKCVTHLKISVYCKCSGADSGSSGAIFPDLIKMAWRMNMQTSHWLNPSANAASWVAETKGAVRRKKMQGLHLSQPSVYSLISVCTSASMNSFLTVVAAAATAMDGSVCLCKGKNIFHFGIVLLLT